MQNWLKTQIPTAVILLAILVIGIVLTGTGQMTPAMDTPALTATRGVILAIVGLLAGFLGGIIGTGGCSVMLPVLHFWMGYPAPIAVGTTLFAVIFTAISGGYGHLLRRNLDKRAVAWLGGAGILGVLIGSWLFTFLSSQSALLGLILGLLFLWPALRMIWEGIRQAGYPQKEGNQISAPATGLALFGLIVGMATGIAGLGGGYALVPGLIYLFGAPVYITMGTSLATMIPLALVGGSLKLAGGFVHLSTGLILAAGTMIGAQIGAAMIKRFKPATLKLIFGLYFLYVSVKFMAAFFGIKVW
ncbi:sulfite exporter TauE/SafE family protein [Anaerolinea sp.]|uniref:sulfite exporter TauE/SafE family protein n=1 Tax=Anaerolinea sp. TaxID=1872519 RepID=UPI002ACE43E0|nr:sulfite exporter TauE/SafE family protein [Anaerolinea sp.]